MLVRECEALKVKERYPFQEQEYGECQVKESCAFGVSECCGREVRKCYSFELK